MKFIRLILLSLGLSTFLLSMLVSAQFATVNRSYIKDNSSNQNATGAQNIEGKTIVQSVLDPLTVPLQISYVRSTQQFIADLSDFLFNKTPRQQNYSKPIEEAQEMAPVMEEANLEDVIGKTPRSVYIGRSSRTRDYAKASNKTSNKIQRIAQVKDETSKISMNLNPESEQTVEHLSYKSNIEERPVLRMPSTGN